MDQATTINALGWVLYGAAGAALVLTVVETRRRRWRWLLLPLVIALACLIWAFIIMIRWPAAARVEVPVGTGTTAVTERTLDGRYFSFVYTSNWTLNYHDLTPTGNYLERAQVSVADPHPYRLVVSVETLTQPFDELPAVQSRRRDLAGQYSEGTRNVGGQAASEFWLTSSAFERTIFLVRSDKLYVMSLTSPTTGSGGDELFNTYAASWIIK